MLKSQVGGDSFVVIEGEHLVKEVKSLWTAILFVLRIHEFLEGNFLGRNFAHPFWDHYLVL